MRGALTRKLRSQRGASLLLALLFLFLSSMVSASILMAAVSNAGKHRSNLTEHQTYLAISSAVSLLCDELGSSSYSGRYSYQEYTQIITGADGSETSQTIRRFRQEPGTYTHADPGSEGYLKELLLDDFDALFAAQIQEQLQGKDITIEALRSGVLSPHELTLTPDTGTALDDLPVTVTLEMTDAYAMYLTARLGDYEIQAELTPVSSSIPALPAELPATEHYQTYSTDPMQWKIGWIITGEEETEP